MVLRLVDANYIKEIGQRNAGQRVAARADRLLAQMAREQGVTVGIIPDTHYSDYFVSESPIISKKTVLSRIAGFVKNIGNTLVKVFSHKK